jgi:Protein of unknown function (DUF664)
MRAEVSERSHRWRSRASPATVPILDGLLDLIDETARHAGHADATRALRDGLTGD